MDEQWVSVAEAERISGRKRRTLRAYAHAGRLRVRYIADGSVTYHAADLARVATRVAATSLSA